MNDSELVRVFVAIDLPAEVKTAMVGIQKRLDPFLDGVRWLRPEGIHLTLRFLGDIPSGDVPSLAAALDGEISGQKPLELSVAGIGAFPGFKRRPRVLWLGVEGMVDGLARLYEKVEMGVETCGFAKEERPFLPHVTIGRTKSNRGMIFGLSELVDRGFACDAGTFVAREVTLFRSELKPGGAVYTELAHFPLNG